MTNTRTILMGLGTGVVFATLAVFFFADEMDVPAFLDGEAGDAQSAFSILQKLEPEDDQQNERLQRLKAKVGGVG